jgi:predicted nucleic acid-binding protein
MARSLVDTNILIYSRDLDEPEKRLRAIELIDGLAARGELVLTVQCLNEFSAASLRRGVEVSEVETAVTRWRDLGEVSRLEVAATTAALAVARHRLSFWDALIWATARGAAVPVVFSEDFQHGRELEGVRFLNPFRNETVSAMVRPWEVNEALAPDPRLFPTFWPAAIARAMSEFGSRRCAAFVR